MYKMKKYRLDIVTKLILILYSCIVIFLLFSYTMETALILLLTVLQLLLSEKKKFPKITITYFIFVIIQYTILPITTDTVAMMLTIIVVLFRKMFPVAMAGKLLITTTTVSELLCGLQQIKVPRCVTIPLAVTLRYIPAVKEECGYIHDAMLLRKSNKKRNILLKLKNLIEGYYVPLLVTASEMSEELSAAAITRGIENPGKRTVMYPNKIRTLDCIVYLLLIIFLAGVLIGEHVLEGGLW